MKLLLLPFLSALCMSPANKQLNAPVPQQYAFSTEPAVLNFQDDAGNGKMLCIKFKAQEYCRAEVPDFDFDARFTVLSATAYFSGANFEKVEKGFIKSASLKPIKNLMDRCLPGTRVLFDDIKVKGPDGLVRTIQGVSWLLY